VTAKQKRIAILTAGAALLMAVAIAVGNGGPEPIAVSDVPGTYRTATPYGRATLVVKEDGAWNYLLDTRPELRPSGKWTLETTQSTPTLIALSLFPFAFGFPRDQVDPQRPTHHFFYFSKRRTGKIETCLENLGTKFGPKGRLCFEQE
jgi:hypothetical protein